MRIGIQCSRPYYFFTLYTTYNRSRSYFLAYFPSCQSCNYNYNMIIFKHLYFIITFIQQLTLRDVIFLYNIDKCPVLLLDACHEDQETVA